MFMGNSFWAGPWQLGCQWQVCARFSSRYQFFSLPASQTCCESMHESWCSRGLSCWWVERCLQFRRCFSFLGRRWGTLWRCYGRRWGAQEISRRPARLTLAVAFG